MKTIKLSKYKTSQLNSIFNSVSSIEIEDSPFARGGFGEVYICKSLSGKSIQNTQVIKILLDDGTGSASRGINTISKLQDKIIDYNLHLKQTNQQTLETISSLQALPQFSFEGILDGKTVLGYSANLLSSNSWYEFGDIFNHDDLAKRSELRNSFYNLPHDFRLKFAHDLAEGFLHLQKMNFIYADLNPKNFFVNEREGKLCLIDFEGGAVNENPETYGKPGQWLAPEIQKQLINGPSLIKVDLNTDTWAVAIGVHFLLFPFHPLFFLKRLGVNEIKDYFKNYQWPNIDKGSHLFNQSVAGAYDWYINKINTELSVPLANTFKETINHGYFNPGRRLSYKQWLNAIDGLMIPPSIKSFTAIPEVVNDGAPVTLNWEIDSKAHSIIISNGVGDVSGKNEITFIPKTNALYTITAIGHFGTVEKTVSIRVFPTPLIETIFVAAPIINESTFLSIQIPKFPHVDISINHIQNGIQLNEQKMHVDLPKFNTNSFEDIELMKGKTDSSWGNILSPLYSRFSNINKWIFRKNKI